MSEDKVESEVPVSKPYILEYATADTDLRYPTATNALYANINYNEEGDIAGPITFDSMETIDKVTGVSIMYDSLLDCPEEKGETYTFELSVFCNPNILG